MPRKTLTARVVTAALAGILLIPSLAQASIYWANNGDGGTPAAGGAGATVGRASNDGANPVQTFVNGANLPCGVAVDAGHVYWANFTTGAAVGTATIGRAALDGSAVEQSFITGASSPCGVAVDAGFVYWTNVGHGIGRARIDGTQADQQFIVNPGITPCGIAVDGAHVYWGVESQNAIGRANLDGTGVQTAFITLPAGSAPCGVAADAGHLYWTNTGASTIGRANLDGSSPQNDFITGALAPCGVAVDAGNIYWANNDHGAGSTIGRAALDGSGVQQGFIAGAAGPCGVSVDATAGPVSPGPPIAPPAPRPPAPFSPPPLVPPTSRGALFARCIAPLVSTVCNLAGDFRRVITSHLDGSNAGVVAIGKLPDLQGPAAVSEDGSEVAVQIRTGAFGYPILVGPTDGSQPPSQINWKPHNTGGGGALGMAFSPDGNALAVITPDGLLTVAVDNRNPDPVMVLPNQVGVRGGIPSITAEAVSWTSKGLVIERSRYDIPTTTEWFSKPATHELLLASSLPDLRHATRIPFNGFAPVASPVDDRVAYVNSFGVLRVTDPRAGDRVVSRDPGAATPVWSPDGTQIAVGGKSPRRVDARTGQTLAPIPGLGELRLYRWTVRCDGCVTTQQELARAGLLARAPAKVAFPRPLATVKVIKVMNVAPTAMHFGESVVLGDAAFATTRCIICAAAATSPPPCAGATVAPGASCSIAVRFDAKTPGEARAVLYPNADNAPLKSVILTARGRGATPTVRSLKVVLEHPHARRPTLSVTWRLSARAQAAIQIAPDGPPCLPAAGGRSCPPQARAVRTSANATRGHRRIRLSKQFAPGAKPVSYIVSVGAVSGRWRSPQRSARFTVPRRSRRS